MKKQDNSAALKLINFISLAFQHPREENIVLATASSIQFMMEERNEQFNSFMDVTNRRTP